MFNFRLGRFANEFSRRDLHGEILNEAFPHVFWTILPPSGAEFRKGDGALEFCNRRWCDYTGIKSTPNPRRKGRKTPLNKLGVRWDRIFGRDLGAGFDTPFESLDEMWAAVIHPDDQCAVRAGWHGAQKREEGFEIEFRFKRRDGNYRWHLAHFVPARRRDSAGRIPRWYATATDIQTQKMAALKANELYEEAKAAAEAREDLLAIVSHELKNPLSAIQLNLDLCEELISRSQPVQRETHLGKSLVTIRRTTERMGRLVDDLLHFAKATCRDLGIERTNQLASGLLEECIQMHESMASEKHLRLTKGTGPLDVYVRCDRERVLQVFSNLIGNAMKFSPPHSVIEVKAEVQDSEVIFRVRDSGVGISKDKLPFIFDRFWQAKETARWGTGLGLAIAKSIVEAHGGRIWAESAVGLGSVFSFTLPRVTHANLTATA